MSLFHRNRKLIVDPASAEYLCTWRGEIKRYWKNTFHSKNSYRCISFVVLNINALWQNQTVDAKQQYGERLGDVFVFVSVVM